MNNKEIISAIQDGQVLNFGLDGQIFKIQNNVYQILHSGLSGFYDLSELRSFMKEHRDLFTDMSVRKSEGLNSSSQEDFFKAQELKDYETKTKTLMVQKTAKEKELNLTKRLTAKFNREVKKFERLSLDDYFKNYMEV